MRTDPFHPGRLLPAVLGQSVDGGHQCCRATDERIASKSRLRSLVAAASAGAIAAATILSFQFVDWWPFVVALAAGFGIQIALFVHLRRALHRASGKVVAATGVTSAAAMVSCCAHYLVNLLPVLGATGLIGFVGQYQSELFWFGIASNLAGIAYLASRVVSLGKGT